MFIGDADCGGMWIGGGDTMTATMPYYKLNSSNITNYIYDLDISKMLKGKTSENPIIGKKRSNLYKQGYEPLEITFDVLYYDDRTNADTFIKDVGTNSPGNFYCGRSDWYFKVDNINITDSEYKENRLVNKYALELSCKKPWIYSDSETAYNETNYAIPYEAQVVNTGHMDAPIESVVITGKYSGGNHLTNCLIEWKDSSNTVQFSKNICEQFNTEETCSIDEDGIATFTYSMDDTAFSQDVTASGCTMSSNSVSMGASDNFYIIFYGPLPLKKNIQLDAKFANITSDPIVEYSVDGTTYYTGISSSILQDAEDRDETYYVNGTAGKTQVWVKFTCDSGDAVDVSNISFTLERYISNYPDVPEGDSRTIRISDSGSSSGRAGIGIEWRNRKWYIK